MVSREAARAVCELPEVVGLNFKTIVCIQDTLSSRAALGLPAAFRPNASREQRYLAYKTIVVPQTKSLWFLGNWKKSTIITGRDGKFPRVDSGVVCKIPLLARALGLNVEQVKRVRDERVSCIQTLVPNFDLLNVCHIKISLLNKSK